jgi:hypothetical protein
MKAKRPRRHILDCAEPLLSFHQLVMRCGVVLENAKPLFCRTEELKAEVALPFGLCTDCLRIVPEKSDKREYEYVLVEGQLSRDSESGVEAEVEAAPFIHNL